MRPTHVLLVLAATLTLVGRAEPQVAAKPAAPADPAKPAAPVLSSDEQLLKAAGVPFDGPGLLQFFRRRTQPPPEPARLDALLQALGDKDAAVRDRAAGELVAVGSAIVPLLRRAANELDDPNAAERARQVLLHIDGGAALTAAAARCLANHKPAGAAEVLLAVLPAVEEDRVIEEIQAALVAVGRRDGKTDAAVVAALDDPVPLRRAVAAEVLGQVGTPQERTAIRKLLKDPKPDVRRRAALVLANHQDAAAVPTLVGLLGELPADQARPIEDYLGSLAGEWSVRGPAGNDAVSRRLRRDLWATWWTLTDGPALLDEFRRRTPTDAERLKLQALVGRLSAAQVAERDKAVSDILAVGPAIAPYLRQAAATLEGKGPEAARKCLAVLEQGAVPPLPAAAVRLLALRRPDGAAATLLAYLPSAEEESVAEEVRLALGTVAVDGDKADPVLVKALTDMSPERRTAAVSLLAPLTAYRPAVRKLLTDADLNVRLRAALSLGGQRDKDAVPVLIALVTEMPPLSAAQVDDALRSLAEDTAPEVNFVDDAAGRKKVRTAWENWWRAHADSPKIDLTRLDPSRLTLGYTVVVEQYNGAGTSGSVMEMDRRGKKRWHIENLRNPIDAQVLPGDRVLIAEQGTNRVKEVDLKGKVLWEKSVIAPMAAQRLPNGNTFIALRNQLIEVDRAGREVFSHTVSNGMINCARKLRNGQYTYVTYQGSCVRLDGSGKELRTVRIPQLNYYGGLVDMLPNDHVVVPLYNTSKVVEMDANGRQVWEASINYPVSAKRLSGGTTLVIATNPYRIVELDRNGKVVWEGKEFIQGIRAERR